MPELANMRDLMYLLCCRAKLEAIDGNAKRATRDIVAACRLGYHLTGPKTLVEQMVGASFMSHAIETTLIIIGNAQVNREEREFLHHSLRKCVADISFEPDLLIMKFMYLDCLQRMYLSNQDGQKVMDEQSSRRQLASLGLHCQGLLMLGRASIELHRKFELIKMDYDKAKALLTDGLKVLEKAMALEAWKLNDMIKQEHGAFERIQESHPFLNILAIEAINLKLAAHERLRAQTRAWDVITAVLIFKENTGSLPFSLSELQEAGLLQEILVDPFSGKPMKYKRLENNFTVYSYGLDFDDDGGIHRPFGNFMFSGQDGDLVLWPVEKQERSRIFQKKDG